MSKSERADDLFILETLTYVRLAARDVVQPELKDDIDRAIKILEDRKK